MQAIIKKRRRARAVVLTAALLVGAAIGFICGKIIDADEKQDLQPIVLYKFIILEGENKE